MHDPRLKKIRDTLSALKTAERKEIKARREEDEDNANMRVGLQAGTELIASIIAGALIGYGLDKWWGTTPIFLIAMLILGVITGFINVWRTTQGIGHKVGYRDQAENDTKTKDKSTKN